MSENQYKYKKKEVYKLTDILDFGRYAGETVRAIIEKHPNYIEWASNNIDGFAVCDEALKIIEEKQK